MTSIYKFLQPLLRYRRYILGGRREKNYFCTDNEKQFINNHSKTNFTLLIRSRQQLSNLFLVLKYSCKSCFVVRSQEKYQLPQKINGVFKCWIGRIHSCIRVSAIFLLDLTNPQTFTIIISHNSQVSCMWLKQDGEHKNVNYLAITLIFFVKKKTLLFEELYSTTMLCTLKTYNMLGERYPLIFTECC